MGTVFLSNCRCGGEAEFLLEGERIFGRCKICGIRTPSRAASLDYSAKQQVADVWNAGMLDGPTTTD